ncbi:MAG: hypothetical protein ACOY5H_01760 [Pseudomonadota bacterium]
MKWLIDRLIAREERRFGVPLPHLRALADSSLAGFFKLLLLAPIGNHRRHAPSDAWHVARVAATLAEDCGACAQIALYYAHRDGIATEVLRAAADGDANRLSPGLRDVMAFADAIARGHDAPELRERLAGRYGEPAVVELSVAIALARFFPAFKRALGHSHACHVQPVSIASPSGVPLR